jgi:hypothetical protein
VQAIVADLSFDSSRSHILQRRIGIYVYRLNLFQRHLPLFFAAKDDSQDISELSNKYWLVYSTANEASKCEMIKDNIQLMNFGEIKGNILLTCLIFLKPSSLS